MSESLRSLRGNEWPWANRSVRSRQMRDREQFAQVAHDKWANEQLLKKCWLKKSKILFFSMFYICFLIKKLAIRSFSLFWWGMWVNRSGHSSKMSDVSKSLRPLPKNEWPWAIRSGCSEEMSDRERIAQVAQQKWANEWIARFFEQIAHLLIFGQKTSYLLGKPMSEFPALKKSY